MWVRFFTAGRGDLHEPGRVAQRLQRAGAGVAHAAAQPTDELIGDIADAVHRVNTEADVVWVDGHSDYGHAFEVFWNNWGKEISPKTTVLILGDARNNYHASQSWVIKEMRKKARHVYWLNPEPKAYWNTGDSIVGEYGIHADGTYECRNLRQLEKFVEILT